MSADEASALLPGNPLLQLEVPQGPAPVMQLDAGHSLFETNFPQGSWGEILQKAGAFKFLANKVLNGELYELRDYPMPTSSPPPALHGEMRDALDITARLCTTFREESTERLTLQIIGKADMVIDVSLIHEWSGDCWRDVHRNGQLRHADPDTLLNNAAEVKVRKYREAYAAPDRRLAFLPAIMSTSGRIHGEFLRLLHILSG